MARTPEELTDAMRASIPILAAMEVRVVEASPGRVVVELPFEPNRNHFGAIYAGCLYSAAELLGGQIPRVSLDLDGELAGFVPLLKSSEVRFLRPARGRVRAVAQMTDEELERVRVEALARGKADYTLEAEVLDEEDTVLATTSGVYQLRRM